MARKIILTEAQLKNIISKSLLNEANNNLPYKEFIDDMKKMGFTRDPHHEGSREMFIIPKYGDKSLITVHEINPIKASVLMNVFNQLNNNKWFGDKNLLDNFPFEKWGVSKNKLEFDFTNDNINNSNIEYKDANVIPVFQEKDSICVLEYNNKVNLCRSNEDRRPLLDKWFDKFDYDNKTGIIPCLKIDNFETCETEAYPINHDGTLDIENLIIESKNNGKQSIL